MSETDERDSVSDGTKAEKKAGYTEEERKIIMEIFSRALAEAHKKVAQEIRSGYITPDMSREEILSLPLWENDSPLEMLTTTGDDDINGQ